ncbi:BPIFB6 isoform 2 [Pan troglodytes]|uniref:BPIFB6 isoform 2 n=1 Tax=Pan troglodytes TaxID=9598 RepID=A0A2J8JY98_PANTR|nr:BPIFB6 isoform 2 [Pan troglodytes]
MLRILCLALCSLLTGMRADPGALLRLGMDIMNREVQSAMDESHILEKMAAEAGKKQPGMKPIKGITNEQGHFEEEMRLESQISTLHAT